jgi:adenosylcobinamide-GDP ribazoletransferase
MNGEWLADRANDLRTGVLFLTRLPVPWGASRGLPSGTPDNSANIARAAWAFPIVGVLVGLIGALVYAAAYKAGLPAWPAAALAVAATLAVTGCLHEDGLADTADGFGGGKTREQKLAIMRDSRIGTYGVCVLTLSLLLRVSAVASFADPGLAAAALIAAHSAARATMPMFMLLMPPARNDGLSFTAGRPPLESAALAIALGLMLLVICFGLKSTIIALVLLAIVSALMARLSLSQIDGQTGDVVGALEQVCEIVILLVALR